MHIAVPGALDLSKSLASGQVFLWRQHGPWQCGLLGGNVVHLRQVDGGLEVEGGPADPEILRCVVASFLRLDDPVSDICRDLASRDARLRVALQAHQGLRVLRQDPWECTLAFVCSIDSNIPRIRRNLDALARRYGQPMTWGGCTHWRLPGPQALAAAGESALRALGLGFRARYLSETAWAVAEGGVALAELRSCPTDEARSTLLRLSGVGEKVADCILLFSLDKLEAFPLDRWVRKRLVEWYFPGHRLTDRALRAWARDYFGPYAGYAQQLLFYGARLEAGRSF